MPTTRKLGRRVSLGLAAGAVLLGMAEPAAATTFKGKMTVTGNVFTESGTGSVTVVGNNVPGNSGSVCSTVKSNGGAKVSPLREGVVSVPPQPGSVAVAVQASVAPGDCATGQLSAGYYTVNFLPGQAYVNGSTTPAKSCMTGSKDAPVPSVGQVGFPDELPPLGSPTDPVTNLGTIRIDASGAGAGRYRIAGPANGPTDEAAICVSNPTGTEGNQAPITLL
ncbi:MAG TPA: hypothetical protein VK988_13765 [Acidimicrobiales bacterium]|nr:hypothetical protein [Acidimicrobiales bacterium]